MLKIKVSFDTWIQLLGLLSVLGGLVFVGLEMQQSQVIALAAQQQSRTEVFVDIIGGFDAADKSFVDYVSGITDESYFDDSNVVRDAVYQAWMVYENDFLQYKLGLMDSAVWDAKLDAMLALYNSCNFREITDLVLGFSTAELSELLSETSENQCP